MTSMNRFVGFLLVGASSLGVASGLACSSSSSSTATLGPDAGTDSPATPDAPPGTILEHGRVVDFGDHHALSGATITIGAATTKTAADGKWSIAVPIGTPARPRITLDGYINVNLPEEISTADNDRKDLPLPDLMTFQLGMYAQPGYDLAKASISIAIDLLPSCASADGATLQVVSPAGAKVEYFLNGFPSTNATAVKQGETPAVTVYNLDPGVDFVFEVTHPTCKQAPFPVTVGAQTLTGKTTTEAGNANSVAVIYMQ